VPSKYESANPLAEQSIISHNSVNFLSLDISNKQINKQKPNKNLFKILYNLVASTAGDVHLTKHISAGT